MPSRTPSELEKLADLGRLTSKAGHEIRNPLNALVIHTSLLDAKLRRSGLEVQHHLRALEDETRRLHRMLEGLLEFVLPEKLEAGFAPEPVDFGRIVRSALERVAEAAAERGIHIRSEVADGLPSPTGSADLLEKALSNVMGNSIEAMPRGGELRVRVLLQEESSVALVVEDSGEGIAPESLPKVFDLFYTTKNGAGGIGLSLVYRIAQLHGGDVRVESERGSGTRLTITLPV